MAIELAPSAELHEMKSQALMETGEIYPAIVSAQKAVDMNPNWAEGYQTLGRAQVNLGELELAIESFTKSLQLKPDFEEVANEDLPWCKELLQKKISNRIDSRPVVG